MASEAKSDTLNSWVRPIFSISAGMWLATHWHLDFWRWSFILSFAVLISMWAVWMLGVAAVYFWRQKGKV